MERDKVRKSSKSPHESSGIRIKKKKVEGSKGHFKKEETIFFKLDIGYLKMVAEKRETTVIVNIFFFLTNSGSVAT